MAKVKCLSVHVYRWGLGDCTNGGVSSKYDTLYIMHPEGHLELDENDVRILTIEKDVIGDDFHAVPYNQNGKSAWYMFGGNFIYAGDSRFPFYHAIRLHDRHE